MPRDWQKLTNSDGFSNVMRLVHLAMRQDATDEQALRTELLKARRSEYEATLTELATGLGCTGRQGRLGEGPILSQLNETSEADAKSIVNTYNYDLAIAVIAIRTEVPTANRHVYAKRLQTWETNRDKWKNEQISLNTNLTARSLAQADFMANNPVEGTARLVGPDPAAEPICQGWLNRGNVPMETALANPSPFHFNCPHSWEYRLKKLKKSECKDLWMGFNLLGLAVAGAIAVAGASWGSENDTNNL